MAKRSGGGSRRRPWGAPSITQGAWIMGLSLAGIGMYQYDVFGVRTKLVDKIFAPKKPA